MDASLARSLEASLGWFERSGVMSPADGSWGVGERIVMTEGNTALEKTLRSFPAYVRREGHVVMEHRRPDCNFEAALMFLLASKALDAPRLRDTAANLLRYLYCRSGMRNPDLSGAGQYPAGAWKWAHHQWSFGIWFDDNAWNCAIPLAIAKFDPALDAEFGLRESALTLAGSLAAGFERQFGANLAELKDIQWAGDLNSPHWGSLVAMAMAAAHAETGEARYAEVVARYDTHVRGRMDSFTTSERAYALLGACAARNLGTARLFADSLLGQMDPATGNIPSEWGKEAPVGKHLVDLIYTMNWAALGLQSLAVLTGEAKYRQALEKALGLVVGIQDATPAAHLEGCWRGMYDLEAKAWGGGDCYEGGANSIYSGWTNAPLAIAIATELLTGGREAFLVF